MFLLGFPLLLVPFAIYNIIAFLMPGVSWTGMRHHRALDVGRRLDDVGRRYARSLWRSCCSVVEVMKSTRIGMRTVVDHALSLILFLGMLVEFMLVKQAATATFFLLLVISFVDVLGGFAVTLAFGRSATSPVDGVVERVSS